MALPEVVTSAARYDEQIRHIFGVIENNGFNNTCIDTTMQSAQLAFGSSVGVFHIFDYNNLLPIWKAPVKRDVERKIESDEPADVREKKAKLCLAFIPQRITGEGTYPRAFDAACVLLNEFGVDEGYRIANDCDWLGDWDLYRKLESIENDGKAEDHQKRLGSLIAGVREDIAPDVERLEEFNLRLEQINKTKAPVQTSGELVEDSKATGQKIQDLLDRIVELELDIDHDTWSERQALMKQMTSLGPSKGECKQRVFDHICAFFGVDLGATKGNQIKDKGRDRARKMIGKLQEPWLVPGYLKRNRDAIFFGNSGSGKTTISLDMVRSLAQGRTFADGKEPCQEGQKALFIASDGGSAAEGILMQYLNDLGVMHSEKFWNNFRWWSSDEESTTPPWTLTLGNMILLQNRVKEGDIDLVVIDSLKAVTAGTEYSIDDRNIGEVMRLIQAIVCPHAALVWVHHTNKSGAKSSHRAGGVTDIIEVVSAAFEVEREWVDGQSSQASHMIIQKLRGEDTRKFDFEFDWLGGVKPLTELDGTARELEARRTAIPESILVAIRDSEFGRLARKTLADNLNVSPNTIDNYLNDHKKNGLIVQARQSGWKLTKKGIEVADSLSRKRLEALQTKPSDLDF